jgi:hypothetical protein
VLKLLGILSLLGRTPHAILSLLLVVVTRIGI